MEKLNFEQLKADIHITLISKLDLEKLSTVQGPKAKQAVASLIQSIILDGKLPLSAAEKEKIQSDLLDEVFGLGPLRLDCSQTVRPHPKCQVQPCLPATTARDG